MKRANPFVPTVSVLAVPQRDRRQWVKVAVLSSLGGLAGLLVALLMYDYQSELRVRARSARDASDLPTLPGEQSSGIGRPHSADPTAAPNAAAIPSVSRTAPDPSPQAARVATTESVSPAVGRADIIYAVRSGDTLSQIARLYGTTVKAIKACNNLTTERLAVGAKLRLPNGKLLSASASQPGSFE